MKEQTFILPRDVERNLTRVNACLSAMPRDKDVRVTIGEAKKERSDDQNSALWGVAYKAIAEFTGYRAPELHDVMCRLYFGEVEVEVMGRTVIRPRRSTTIDEEGRKRKLSTVEFNAFYSFVQQQGAELGVWVPDPDPRWNERAQERAA